MAPTGKYIKILNKYLFEISICKLTYPFETNMNSLAKAGLVCALPARTTILAAANPVAGHYNRSKTVHENIDLKPSLLSRFDLIFFMLDRPNIVTIFLISEQFSLKMFLYELEIGYATY